MGAEVTPGVYPELGAEAYHSARAVGKSSLWTLHCKTPAHVHGSEDEPSSDMDFGSAVHVAVLEPHRFDRAVIRGPEGRRGNKWKDALAEHPNSLVLPSPLYDKVLRMRDTVMRDPIVRQLSSEFAMIEHSAFWRDEETGLMCKCRPDLYRADESLMVDMKTTGDATKQAWLKRAMDMGYHVQDTWYSDGWQRAAQEPVDTFLFLVVERDPPFAHAIYELGPGEKDLGRRIARKALQRYAACAKANDWPGHMSGVQVMTFPEYVYSKEVFDGIYVE